MKLVYDYIITKSEDFLNNLKPLINIILEGIIIPAIENPIEYGILDEIHDDDIIFNNEYIVNLLRIIKNENCSIIPNDYIWIKIHLNKWWQSITNTFIKINNDNIIDKI